MKTTYTLLPILLIATSLLAQPAVGERVTNASGQTVYYRGPVTQAHLRTADEHRAYHYACLFNRRPQTDPAVLAALNALQATLQAALNRPPQSDPALIAAIASLTAQMNRPQAQTDLALLSLLSQRQAAPSQPQIIIVHPGDGGSAPRVAIPLEPRPRYEIPLEPRPRYEIPLEPRPRVEIPLEPRPRVEIPLEPRPRVEIPLDPKPRMDIPLGGTPRNEIQPIDKVPLPPGIAKPGIPPTTFRQYSGKHTQTIWTTQTPQQKGR